MPGAGFFSVFSVFLEEVEGEVFPPPEPVPDTPSLEEVFPEALAPLETVPEVLNINDQ